MKFFDSRHSPLSATVFIYERKRKPYESRVVYYEDARAYANNPKWVHTGTLNPAAWIEYLLNHPEEREKHIEELFAK